MANTNSSDPLVEAMQDAVESVERMEEEQRKIAETAPDDPQDTETVVEVATGADNECDGESSTSEEEAGPEIEAARAKEQLLRMAADFENFRKRAQREKEQIRQYGTEQVLTEMLSVLDNLERALAHTEDDKSPLVAGVQMVAKQFEDVLARFGVEGFKSVGEPFNPERHEAMSQIPTVDAEPGRVLEEMSRGFTLNGRLLRPARVVVASAPPQPEANSEPEGKDEQEH